MKLVVILKYLKRVSGWCKLTLFGVMKYIFLANSGKTVI